MSTAAAGKQGHAARMTTRNAAFIGIGSMVGAGIFALIGEAGAYAGSALWISFVLAGGIALLQGYSFAKFGARYPSAGGFLEYLVHGFGNGHLTGMTAWLVFVVNAILTSLVAVSFGSYAAELFLGGGAPAVKLFAAAVIVVLTVVNARGVSAVEKAQDAIVWPLIGVLAGFAILGFLQINPALLAPSTYPPARDILSSVGLTFFAFLGFGIVSFTAGDLEDAPRSLPRAMYLALGVTMVLYVAVAVAVYGTLTPEEVQASGATALAKAAEPLLGQAGYTIMAVAALLATSSTVNAGLYPARGFSADLVTKGQFPPVLARQLLGGNVGLLVTAALTLLLALLFNLSAIANMGSAAALLLFLLVSIAHLRVIHQTGARRWLILLGALVTGATLVYFTVTTVAKERATMIALIVFILLSVGADLVWKWARDTRAAGGAGGAPSPPPAAESPPDELPGGLPGVKTP
jgi:amino acid transporter